MKALIQRVSSASVTIDGQETGSIGQGLVVFLGIVRDDTLTDAEYIVNKVLNIRLFNNEETKFDFSVRDLKAELLIVSQFTLCALTKKGRRPSFVNAMAPDPASLLYTQAVKLFEESKLVIKTGIFQAHMDVSLTNDGPVTIIVDSSDRSEK